MRPTWLIEASVYGDEIVPLLDEIRRQGMVSGRHIVDRASARHYLRPS